MINFLNFISPIRLWRRFLFKRSIPENKIKLIDKLIKGNHILMSFQVGLTDKGVIYSIKESSFMLKFGESLFTICKLSLKKDKIILQFNSNLDNSSIIESIKEGELNNYLNNSTLTVFSDSTDYIQLKNPKINYYYREVEYAVSKQYITIYQDIFSRLTATEKENVYIVLSESPYEQR